MHRASLLLQAVVVDVHISSTLLLHGSVSPRMLSRLYNDFNMFEQAKDVTYIVDNSVKIYGFS